MQAARSETVDGKSACGGDEAAGKQQLYIKLLE